MSRAIPLPPTPFPTYLHGMEKNNCTFTLPYLRRGISQSLNLQLHTTEHSKTRAQCPERVQIISLRTSNSTITSISCYPSPLLSSAAIHGNSDLLQFRIKNYMFFFGHWLTSRRAVEGGVGPWQQNTENSEYTAWDQKSQP
jgi:hypothetical protein